jgi:predicted GH43/DUF377 family glycosyl hydrolase
MSKKLENILFIFLLFILFSCGKNTKQADPDFQSMIQPVPASAKFINDSLFIWGGSLVKSVSDNNYHMFYSRWPRNLKMGAWVTHSEIAHAVADSPFGPFVFHDVALPKRGGEFWDGVVTHNPTIHVFNGKYYLYYMGTTGDIENRQYWDYRNKQRIGVAVANDPSGPWKRSGQPLIDVSPDSTAHDAVMVSNPSVTQMPDGKYLMIYKAVAQKGKVPQYGPVVHLTAISDNPEGPFTKQNKPIFTVTNHEFPAEDPYVWYDKNSRKYLAIVKDMKGAFTDAGRSLVLFCSDDGFDWKLSASPLVSGLNLKWENGSDQKLLALERPQLFFENGRPVALLCAVNETLGHSYNIQIPLKP